MKSRQSGEKCHAGFGSSNSGLRKQILSIFRYGDNVSTLLKFQKQMKNDSFVCQLLARRQMVLIKRKNLIIFILLILTIAFIYEP